MTAPRRIALLGSTGSIGTQALDVIARFPDRFEVVGLCAGRVPELVAQARQLKPRFVAVKDPASAAAVRSELPGVEVREGVAGAEWLASHPEVDFVLSAISGGSGMRPTAAAGEAGKVVGLANKESIVLAGEWITQRARATGATILPIDSEHSAIFQCLQGLPGDRRDSIRRLLLTASGGPFWSQPREALDRATPDAALRHPTWSMGKKITIDSATLMNKALEVVEARWLFDLPPEQIQVIVHPESVVHSMVELVDGAVLAQLGVSDMRGPIAYALGYPERLPLGLPRLDLPARAALHFAEPDHERFPAVQLAYRALARGGTAPAALSGADEACVQAVLAGRRAFRGITAAGGQVLEAHPVAPVTSVESAWAASEAGRLAAEAVIAAAR